MLHIVERLEHLAAGAAQADDSEEDIFTEEDRRLIEIVEREFVQHMCCNCDRPIPGESMRSSMRDNPGLE
jgi:hypothetical protein